MPEPTSSAAVTLATHALAMPALTVAGVGLGLRADVLLAGFCGAVAAMALLNTVPGSGDTWPELLRTSARRVGVSVGSAVTAGYISPLLALINGVPGELILSVAFVAGAFAQKLLPWIFERLGGGKGIRPPPGDDDGPPPAGMGALRGGGQ
jgi:hypothetical protein